MATFTIEVVPASGQPETKDVELDPSGATVREVLAAAGMTGANMNLTIDGKPATLETHVSKGGKVTAKKIVVTERASGS